MNKGIYFLNIFKKAEKTYEKNTKRLAGEGWAEHWQTLIATIMSAQSRDETTIPVAEKLFAEYNKLEILSNAEYKKILKIFKSLNYNKTKAKNVISAAKFLIKHYNGKVPDSMEELIKIPGVGRKTANLVLSECHSKDSITVDTHVHRISNVLNIVKTKTPEKTELELQKIVPKRYWSRINRIFVLWGKDAPGKNKKRLLEKIS